MAPANSNSRPRFVFSTNRSTFASHGIADPYPHEAALNRNTLEGNCVRQCAGMSPDGAADAYRLCVPASAWSDPASWAKQRKRELCPICVRGAPLDVLADFYATWITGGTAAPLPGYACVVSKHHVVEPFELSAIEAAAFW